MPSRESSATIARRVCVENAAAIGTLTEENIVPRCITPLATYIQGEVDRWIAEKKAAPAN